MLIYFLSLLFVVAGISHFMFPKFFAAMIPPYLPYPKLLVLISGVLEIILGTLLLFPEVRTLTGIGLIALLIAVFPANIYMAQRMTQKENKYSWVAWARLPMQFVLIYLVYSVM